MKCIFNFLFYIFSLNICFSASYESNSINTVKSTKVINLPDGSSYSTLEVDGSGSNNLGIYEIIYCAGHRISKNSKLIQQDFYCNVELSNNDYYTFLMKRSETDTDAGVGYIVIAGGSKPFEQIKNKKCNYAVSFFRDQAYVKIKCEVDEDFLKEFQQL